MLDFFIVKWEAKDEFNTSPEGPSEPKKKLSVELH